jgi:hypothetical protein
MAISDAPFSISLVGDETGEKWVGDFRAKERLTHRDTLIKDARRRELLGTAGGEPDPRALSVAIIVSELTVRLTKMPKWFEESGLGLELEDENVLADIYDKAIKVQLEAKKAREKKSEEDRAELAKEAAKGEDK